MAPLRKEITPFQHGEIVGAWKCGISEYPPSTVHKIIVTFRDSGQEIPPAHVGRPKIMTPRDNRALTRILKQNRRTNIKELPRQNWESEWENIIWSDESHFELFKGDGRRWVWRQPHEKYDFECLIPTVKSGQVEVMVWGCFTKNGLGLLVKLGLLIKLEGKINVNAYIELLDNYLLPYMDTLDDENNYIFQEDNAPIHTARALVGCLERKVRAHNPLPKNKEELWQILQEEWLNIVDNIYQNLVNSMPHRITAVINCKGNPTKY
ncbi:IS630 family transposase [Rhizophagus clarus]|uniref:IS630 family transposase n=1 Tax=Rhizophagus clarus TaxID=94130 RepID=A0A8H3M0W7_9GLOM|nr:IS630 family transposase [Rhizophagus clarus]